MTHCVRWGPWPPRKRGYLGVEPHPQLKHAIANCCCHLANRNEEEFRLFPNYFGFVYCLSDGAVSWLRQLALLCDSLWCSVTWDLRVQLWWTASLLADPICNTVHSARKDVGAECRHDMRPSVQSPNVSGADSELGQMKFSALNVDFNSASFDPLGSRNPSYMSTG